MIFLAHNGIGLGHLSRTTAMCDVLRRAGQRPLVYTQGLHPDHGLHTHPGKHIPPLLKLTRAELGALARELRDLSLLSSPSIVVEDTLPCDLDFGSDTRRILVVRPTTFPELCRLNDEYARTYESFLLADAPGSPTWPYSEAETRILLEWPRWKVIGPVYRSPTEPERREAASRIGLEPRQRLCVFSMGGGGLHPGSDDARHFLDRAAGIARELRERDPMARTVLVRGPYFPADLRGGEWLEEITFEPLMPALFSVAHAAVIRPGFNSVWECIAGGTPFLPLPGTSYREPMARRLDRIARLGLSVDDVAARWGDEGWRAEHAQRCRLITAAFDGRPRVDDLAVFGHAPEAVADTPAPGRLRVLLVAIDSVGIGHVVRSVRLGTALRDAGHEVLLAVESAGTWDAGPVSIPMTTLPRGATARQLETHLPPLRELLSDFDPEVVVLDTHTPQHDVVRDLAEMRFRTRVAVVSLPSAESLVEWADPASADAVYLLHAEREFAEIYGPGTAALPSARLRFAGGPIPTGPGLLAGGDAASLPDSPFALVVLGGGGEHAGVDDMARIPALVNELALHLRARHGLETVLVAGPHFAHRAEVRSEGVRYLSYAPNLAEYLAGAEVVVARPGFNLTREAYRSARRLVLLETHQFREATAEHLRFLAKRPGVGVAPLHPEGLVAAVDRLLAAPVEPRPAPPWGDGLPAVLDAIERADPVGRALDHLVGEAGRMRGKKGLLLRIDDVVRVDEELDWLLSRLCSRGLRSSLEVIPYLAELSEGDLDTYDLGGSLVEVSQHGFAHIPQRGAAGRKMEFLEEDLSSPRGAGVVGQLREGWATLAALFPRRFRGGYSAPYDGWASWLPAVWKECGGEYLSYIWERPARSPLPAVRVPCDPWDWEKRRARSPGAVAGELFSGLVKRGETGLVFHPGRIRSARERDWTERLLDALARCGTETLHLSGAAGLQAQALPTSPLRSYAFQPPALDARRGLPTAGRD